MFRALCSHHNSRTAKCVKNGTYFNQTQVLMEHQEGSLGKQNKTSLPIFLCCASSASTFWLPMPTLGTSPFNLLHIDLSWRIWLWPISFKACEQNVCYFFFFLLSFILYEFPRLRLLPAPNAKGERTLCFPLQIRGRGIWCWRCQISLSPHRFPLPSRFICLRD